MPDRSPHAAANRSPVYVGCPLWGHAGWVGRFYTADARPADFLRQYASVFNAVEGNTTFYSLPSADAVARWSDVAPAHFRFSFKLPREITHTRLLDGCSDVALHFLDRMAPLGDRLGPLLLQLPPIFGPDRLGFLDRFLDGLPEDIAVAVEPRHPRFFTSPDALQRLDGILEGHGAERASLDTRALRSGDPHHPGVASARHRKPDLPVLPVALTRHPMVRWVGHPETEVNEPWLEEMALRTAGWIEQGREPYIMIHCPDTDATPVIARRFAERLSAVAGAHPSSLPGLSPFPTERAAQVSGQLSLFKPSPR